MQLNHSSTVALGLLLLAALITGCNRVGTDDDRPGETGDTDGPECEAAAPLRAIGQAVLYTCEDRWTCDSEQHGDYHRFYNECSRELLKIVRDCHRVNELAACAEVTGRCAKFEAESCARAFAPCDG